nr:phospholipase A2 inhibitor subunit gamma B-like [Pogona vitticeps]
MKVLLRLFLFLTLLKTGAPLKCETCESHGTNCTSTMKTCPPHISTCAVALIENALEGEKMVSVRKGCEFLEMCPTEMIQFSVGNETTYRANVICCIGASCEIVYPYLQLPPIQPKTNGMKCPACYTKTGTCGHEMVACTGLQKFCFEVSSVSYAGGEEVERIMKGCTTESVCASLRNGHPLLVSHDLVKSARCTPDVFSHSETTKLLIPSFSGLLLLAIFF